MVQTCLPLEETRMFYNLKNALNTKNISIKAFAAVIGVCKKTAYNKINGDMEFTLSEVMTIKKELLPEYDFNYLFESEKEPVKGGDER